VASKEHSHSNEPRATNVEGGGFVVTEEAKLEHLRKKKKLLEHKRDIEYKRMLMIFTKCKKKRDRKPKRPQARDGSAELESPASPGRLSKSRVRGHGGAEDGTTEGTKPAASQSPTAVYSPRTYE